MKPAIICVAISAATLCATGTANAQSLFQRPVAPVPASALPIAPAAAPGGSPGNGPASNGPPTAAPGSGVPTMETAAMSSGAFAVNGPGFASVSLAGVKPPLPRTYQKHDKIEIIINETSTSLAESNLETKTTYDAKAELSQFPSLKDLLYDASLRDGITGDTPNMGVTAKQDYKGDGKLERKDRLTARISGIVIDVKPNGHLVVEATETVQQDEESKTLVVAGVCDPKDVTVQGTVLSNQLANLVIRVDNVGQVKDASEKGFIPRVLEAIFNF
ncbi:MAG: flagellar basal body L-ring protein FlgH [Phycisphaerales bacterium]